MTATDAIWTQGGSFTAAEDRSLISALLGARHFTDLAPEVSKVDAGGGHGVVGASDLAVTPGSGHSVDVAAGQAFIRGTQSAGQGTYLVGNDATLNLAVSTPDATNDRIDLIQIRVSDDSAGAGVTTIDVKAGTPAGSPSAPTPDENALVLAQVLVPASAASSANYTITDKRTRAAALGGILPCTSITRPDPVAEGQFIYELDTNRLYVYDGSAWKYLNSTTREHSIYAVYVPAGTDDTTTASPAYGDWGGSVNITVPPWATKARVTATAAGVFPQTATGSVIDLRIRIGSDFSQSFRFTTYGAADTPRESLTFTGEVTLTSSGTKSLRVEESRVSGTGSFRADTNSDFTFAVDFLP